MNCINSFIINILRQVFVAATHTGSTPGPSKGGEKAGGGYRVVRSMASFGRPSATAPAATWLWALVLALVCAVPLWSQTYLNEQQALELVLQSHPSVQAAGLRMQQQQTLQAAAAQWQPADLFHNIAADPDYGMFGTTAFGFNQAFPARKMTQARRLYYQRREAAAAAGFMLTRRQVARSVSELYQHIGFIQSEAGLYRRLDSLYQSVAAIAQLRYTAGEVSKAEQLALEDKAAQMRLALQTTGHEIEFDRVVLGQVLGIPGQVFPVSGPFQPMSFSLADTALVENSARSVLHRTSIAISEAEQEVVAAQRAPVFSGGLMVQYLPNGRVLPGWQLGLQIPLITKSLRAEQAAAALGVQSAAADYRADLLEQRTQLAHLLHEQEKYQIRLEYYTAKGKALADELLRMAVANYRAGEIGFVELTQFAEQAAAIELDYLENLLGLNMAIIQLRTLTGQ
jgi:cobalt-zinc-cadmium resistance protein CzcA